jgi:hypothetical protein
MKNHEKIIVIDQGRDLDRWVIFSRFRESGKVGGRVLKTCDMRNHEIIRVVHSRGRVAQDPGQRKVFPGVSMVCGPTMKI